MAKKKRDITGPDQPAAALLVRATLLPAPTIPTGDRRHHSTVREGRISFEVFSKARLATLPVDSDVLYGKEAEERLKVKEKNAKANKRKRRNAQNQ